MSKRKEATVSAPGKILWIGGYSVLQRPNICFVTGVDKRVHTHVQREEGGEVSISSPQFNEDWSGKLEETGKTPETLKFVALSVKATLDYLQAKGQGTSGVSVTTYSDPSFGAGKGKSGLGSSAAVTVATVGAVLELFGNPVSSNPHLVHKLAQYAHSAAQGKVGSGFDVAASCFGSCAYSRYSPEILTSLGDNPLGQEIAKVVDGPWDYVATPLALPQGFEVAYGNIVGESTSTSAMIKKVNEYKANNPDGYKNLLDDLDHQNRVSIDTLSRISELAEHKPNEYFTALNSGGKHVLFAEFRRAFESGRELTRRLGEVAGAQIEPPECTALIDATCRRGRAFMAKLPGAGGKDALAALCLSTLGKKAVEEFWMGYKELKIEPVPLKVSNQGVATKNNGV